MQSTATATVTAAPDAVWAILADHEGMAHWAPGLRVALRTEGAPERNGVGAVREINAPGPAPAIVEEITAFEPGARLGYKALSGVPLRNYHGDVTLTADGTGTRIDYTVSADQRVPIVDQLAVAAIARTLLTTLVRRVNTVTKAG